MIQLSNANLIYKQLPMFRFQKTTYTTSKKTCHSPQIRGRSTIWLSPRLAIKGAMETTSPPTLAFPMEEQVLSIPKGKRLAIVTGANKGIGLEICRQLACNGVKVILTARDEKKGTRAVAELREAGFTDVLFHQLDVSNPISIAGLVNFIRTLFGKLDILVNNAGVTGFTFDDDALKALMLREGKLEGEKGLLIMEVTRETYETAEECLDINYHGCIRVTEALSPLLKLSDSANIVNISSTAGQLKFLSHVRAIEQLRDDSHLTEDRVAEVLLWYLKDYEENALEVNGWPSTLSAYKLSKAALNAYTRILSKRYPTFCINSVCPGFVKTDMNCQCGVFTVEEGAKGPVMLAMLPNGGPSGFFFYQMEVSTFD